MSGQMITYGVQGLDVDIMTDRGDVIIEIYKPPRPKDVVRNTGFDNVTVGLNEDGDVVTITVMKNS
jgi:hypothetical protein